MLDRQSIEANQSVLYNYVCVMVYLGTSGPFLSHGAQ